MKDEEIRASSVLPADRRPISLVTRDGLTLVGELALPLAPPSAGSHFPALRAPAATLICVHPLPTHGGMMDSHLLRKAAWRLPALADIAVIRFNSRGTSSAAGTSEGTFDESRGEGLDLAAAIDFAREAGLPRLWLLGWSFGSDVVLRHGDVDGVEGAILVSPPLRYTSPEELASWSAGGRPMVALVPERDDFLRPDEARARFAGTQARIVEGQGAGHLWVGEPYVRMVLDEVAGLLNPGSAPLPRTWPAERALSEGPMERWTDL